MKIIKKTKVMYCHAVVRLLTNKLLYAILIKLAVLARPWIVARFYVAWEEYQKGPVYRERLFSYGMLQAIMSFAEDKWTRDYCLRLRFKKEPNLKWRLLLAPYTIETPSTLAIAAENGLFRLVS